MGQNLLENSDEMEENALQKKKKIIILYTIASVYTKKAQVLSIPNKQLELNGCHHSFKHFFGFIAIRHTQSKY